MQDNVLYFVRSAYSREDVRFSFDVFEGVPSRPAGPNGFSGGTVQLPGGLKVISPSCVDDCFLFVPFGREDQDSFSVLFGGRRVYMLCFPSVGAAIERLRECCRCLAVVCEDSLFLGLRAGVLPFQDCPPAVMLHRLDGTAEDVGSDVVWEI